MWIYDLDELMHFEGLKLEIKDLTYVSFFFVNTGFKELRV